VAGKPTGNGSFTARSLGYVDAEVFTWKRPLPRSAYDASQSEQRGTSHGLFPDAAKTGGPPSVILKLPNRPSAPAGSDERHVLAREDFGRHERSIRRHLTRSAQPCSVGNERSPVMITQEALPDSPGTSM